MPRVIWKGVITFGLVHVPVALYPASQDIGIDFDWLDKRSMDPVGYKCVNKRTGKDIQSEIRPLNELKLPPEGKTAAGLKPAELKMAAQLIGEMTGPWKSDDYSDQFSAAILALVSKKVGAGETATRQRA